MRRLVIFPAFFVALASLAAIACAPASQTAEAPGAPSVRPASVEVIDNVGGAALFARYCSSCHGSGGKGDGRVAAHLRGGVPDLTRLTRGGREPFPVERVIDAIRGSGVEVHGTSVMPIWGPGLMGAPAEWPESRQQSFFSNRVAKLAEHLRSIQVDDP